MGFGSGNQASFFKIKNLIAITSASCNRWNISDYFLGLYRWFSWGMASLPEGKSQGLCLVCKIQASKHCVESLPLLLKIKRSCFSQGERFALQLPLDCTLALWLYTMHNGGVCFKTQQHVYVFIAPTFFGLYLPYRWSITWLKSVSSLFRHRRGPGRRLPCTTNIKNIHSAWIFVCLFVGDLVLLGDSVDKVCCKSEKHIHAKK